MREQKERQYSLFMLLIEVTQKCNANCDQCGSRCDIHSEELLTKDEILSVMQDIKDNLGTQTMINISGGEPLLRADLFEMMTEVSEMGFDWGMVTNGSLITEDVIARMKSSGMKTITISLDGLRDTHDSLRHLPGSYDRILTAIEMLKAENFLDHLQITFTANRRNVYEFEELYEQVKKLGLDSIRVSCMDDIGRAQDNKDLLLKREELLYFWDLIRKLNRLPEGPPIVWGCPHYLGDMIPHRKFRCFTGISTASILYNGDIFVCPNVPRRQEFVQGNIKNDTFSQVWRQGFQYFRKRQLPQYCQECEYKEKCKGDSVHSWDYEEDKPKFCYRDMFVNQSEEEYLAEIKGQYSDLECYEVAGDNEDEPSIYLEPNAYQEIKQYFHFGKRHPQSMYEQQMALIGFRWGNAYVVRYVIGCDGRHRAKDNAIFHHGIVKRVERELKIINENYYKSEDRVLFGSNNDLKKPMLFLGFIHSHPTQSELQYSVGDDRIHRVFCDRNKKTGYIGILVNPEEETMGAYEGKEMRQAPLIWWE